MSVVIPTYNWSAVLPYSIGSVLRQTLGDLELLVVGDGCTDDSAQVVARAGDRRVRWIDLPANTGSQVVPDTVALAEARAPVVAYLGHDDLWAPAHLAALVPVVEAGAAMAHSRCLVVGREGLVVAVPPPAYTYQPGHWLPPTSVAHSRDAARAAGGWLPAASTGDRDPEADLWARIAAGCGPPVLVDRLTCVKLPAALREGVYATRPSHEQRAWTERIAAAPDPEAMLADVLAAAGPVDPARAFHEPAQGGRELDAAQRLAVRRAFKGLPP